MKWDLKINITTLLLIGVALFLLWKWQSITSLNGTLQDNLELMRTEHSSYVLEKTGEIAAYRNSLELSEKQLKKTLESDSVNRQLVKYYKNLSEHVEIKTVFVHDTIKIYLPGLVTQQDDTTVNYSDECFAVDIGVSNGLIGLSGIAIPNTQNILIGDRKNGFLKKATYSVDVVNSNPCIQVVGLQSTTVIVKKKFYQTQWFSALAGATGMFLILNR